jgi:aminoglycoside phosphotransferase (APT) family kinase protein
LTLDLNATATIWREALSVPDHAPRVWIHADLHPFNVISLNGQFGGIIDWSDISQGDPAVDLGFLRLLVPAAAMPTAYDGYGGVDEATAARAQGIALIKAATLAVVDKEVVADIGWQALVELGVARPTQITATQRHPQV